MNPVSAMSDMISQCPKCMTSFKVTEEQLQVAAGKVRCGYCMNVFMGNEYLISGGEDSDGQVDEGVLRSLLEADFTDTDAADHSDPIAATASIEDLPSAPHREASSGEAAESLSAEDFELLAATDSDTVLSEPSDEEDIVANAQLEPDLHLLEENLKFDEDDLRASSDEDWALALLAELEGGTDTSKQAVEVELEPASSADDSEPADTAPPPAGDTADWGLLDLEGAEEGTGEAFSEKSKASKPGLGFEEIIVDAIPLQNTEDDAESAPESTASDTAVAEHAGDESADSSLYEDPAAYFADSSADEEIAESGSSATVEEAVAPDSTTMEETVAPDSVLPVNDTPLSDANTDEDLAGRQPNDFLPQFIDLDQQTSPTAVEPVNDGVEWRWVAAAVALVLGLFVQYLYFDWQHLTTQASTRPAMEKLCSVVPSCKLATFRDLRSIRTDHLTVRTHPDIDNALVADIILTNTAELAQPFPVLQLVFSDLRGQAVAGRKFFPNEYVDGELRGLSAMPSGSPIRVSLEIMDPGPDAVNRQLIKLPSL